MASALSLIELLRSRAWEHRQHREIRERAARTVEMMRARLLDARDHINGGAANIALVDINRALEVSD